MLADYTPEELQAALDSLHDNGFLRAWPTLKQALAAPFPSKLVSLHAHLARVGKSAWPTRAPAPRPRAKPNTQTPNSAGIDFKRHAAGDVD